jgi:heat shock protein HslJ
VSGRRVLLVLALLVTVLAACGGDDDDEGAVAASDRSGSDLVGSTWVLTSYEGRTGATVDAATDAPAALTFRVAGTLVGSTGCNDFGGVYETDGDELSIEVGPMTLKACVDPDVSAQETAVLDALANVTTHDLAGDDLVLLDDGGTTLLTYRPGMTGLAGSAWQVTGVNNGNDAVVTSALTEALTAEFGDDDTFTGNGGCNQLSGAFTTTGTDAVTIGPLMSTRMSCGAEVDELEMQYTAALEASTTYEILGETLTLRDSSGSAQVTATLAP